MSLRKGVANRSEETNKQDTQGTEPFQSNSQSNSTISGSKLAFGVAAVSGACLLAVTMVGLTPVLVAGTAGFLAYQGMTAQRT